MNFRFCSTFLLFFQSSAQSVRRISENDICSTKAEQAGKAVEIKEYLVAGALDILMKEKNQEKHNELVLKEIKKAEQECDVIVLAQGSMTVMLPYLEGISKPVLTSPRRAVERVKQMLAQQA